MKTNKLNLKKEIKSYKKIIAMKCLDCVCCQPKDVVNCEIITCPLWEKRPKELRGLYIYIKELKKKNLGFYEANN